MAITSAQNAHATRSRLVGLLSLAAAGSWWGLANPLIWWRQLAFNPIWAFNNLAVNLGVGLLFLAGTGSLFIRMPRISGWWTRCCCALGLAMVYGAALAKESGASQDGNGKEASFFYALCGGVAVAFVLTGGRRGRLRGRSADGSGRN